MKASRPAATAPQVRLTERRSSTISRCTVSWPTPAFCGTTDVVDDDATSATAVEAAVCAVSISRVAAESSMPMTRVRAAKLAGRGCRSKVNFGPFGAAELDLVLGQQLGLLRDALAVEESAVAAVEIDELELRVVAFAFDADHGVLAADHPVDGGVEGDFRGRIAADGDLLEIADRKLFYLIGLRPRQMSNDDALDDSTHSPAPEKNRDFVSARQKTKKCAFVASIYRIPAARAG